MLKGGEPDVDGVAKMVLNDFLRGKIPWFTSPPKKEGAEEENVGEVVEGRKGALGEMPGSKKEDALQQAVLEQEVFAGFKDEEKGDNGEVDDDADDTGSESASDVDDTGSGTNSDLDDGMVENAEVGEEANDSVSEAASDVDEEEGEEAGVQVA